MPHAGGLQVDQPAGDLLVPLLLQVAQHAALHEHLRDTTGSKRDASSLAEGSALSALTLLEPTTTLRRSTSSSVSSSSTAWDTRTGKSQSARGSRAEQMRERVTDAGPEPDLSLVVADKHGGVALHDGRRQSLEVAPEVAEGHVLGVT